MGHNFRSIHIHIQRKRGSMRTIKPVWPDVKTRWTKVKVTLEYYFCNFSAHLKSSRIKRQENVPCFFTAHWLEYKRLAQHSHDWNGLSKLFDLLYDSFKRPLVKLHFLNISWDSLNSLMSMSKIYSPPPHSCLWESIFSFPRPIQLTFSMTFQIPPNWVWSLPANLMSPDE